jgi:hypothetical protein
VNALDPPGRTVSIAEGETVTIPAGGNYDIPIDAVLFGFDIYGSLTVDGTADDPVVFHMPNATSTDFWMGFYSTGNLVLRHTTIVNASIPGTGAMAIDAEQGTLTVENCILRDLYDVAASAIRINSNVTATVTGTLIEGNWSPNTIGIECFADNSGNTVKIANNTIVNFDTGIKITSTVSDITPTYYAIDLSTNIVEYNHATEKGAIGLDLSYSDLNYLFLDYNLINRFNLSGVENLPRGSVENCVIDEDPLFVDPGSGDYTLQSANSPAHDAGDPDLDRDGTDFDGPDNIAGTADDDTDDQDPDVT